MLHKHSATVDESSATLHEHFLLLAEPSAMLHECS
jgi:hypothetical protein